MSWLLILVPAVKLANGPAVCWLIHQIGGSQIAACALLHIGPGTPPQIIFALLAGRRDEFLQ